MMTFQSVAGKSASNPRPGLLPTFCLLFLGLASVPAAAGTFSEIKDFGTNYSKATMWLYVPAKLAAKPPVLVYPHACSGTASSAYSGGYGFPKLADTYGFLIIYPQANTASKCWDVHSPEALSHNGGGDPRTIISMVQYVL